MPDNNGPAGHPMNEIAAKFDAAAKSRANAPESRSTQIPASMPAFTILPDQIEAPAFFVDRNLCVPRVSPDSNTRFLQIMAGELEQQPDRSIFSLLLVPGVKDSLADWQALFSFVYIALRRSTSRETFESQTRFMDQEDHPVLDRANLVDSGMHRFQVESCPLILEDATQTPSIRLFGLEFTEGTLFLLRPDFWAGAAVEKTAVEETGRVISTDDRRETICILTAKLDDSHRIADTMLADLFFRMMNCIWEEADNAVISLGGTRIGHSGARIQYLFRTSAGRNPIFSAIWCAARMNARMQALQAKLKARHGWSDELFMNMGLSHGKINGKEMNPAQGMEFMVPGGALDQSSQLAAIAGKGEIWITKNAVAQLPKSLMDQVVLGVDRQGEFLRNFFTRISDLPGKKAAEPASTAMGSLAVARILKIEKPAKPESKKD
jgi:class 3 adenylate cyclase